MPWCTGRSSFPSIFQEIFLWFLIFVKKNSSGVNQDGPRGTSPVLQLPGDSFIYANLCTYVILSKSRLNCQRFFWRNWLNLLNLKDHQLHHSILTLTVIYGTSSWKTYLRFVFQISSYKFGYWYHWGVNHIYQARMSRKTVPTTCQHANMIVR